MRIANPPPPERENKPDWEGHDRGTADGRVTILGPLERYWRRGIITGKQYAAGAGYRTIVDRCGFGELSSSGDLSRLWGARAHWDMLPKTEVQVMAREQYRTAIAALGFYRQTVDCVVLFDRTLEDTGSILGLSSSVRDGFTVAKFLFTRGLDTLCKLIT